MKPSKKIAKRLAARIKDYEETKSRLSGKKVAGSYNKPGSRQK